MAQALKLGAVRLFGPDRVHIDLLTSSATDTATLPTKPNFRRAFEQVCRQAAPEDVLVIYLAGQATTVNATYCYFTQEARSFDLSDPVVRKQCSLTGEELTDWLKKAPALKQALILDTGSAVAAVRSLSVSHKVRTGPPVGDQLRALERVKDRTGVYVLWGCAENTVSYEASRYGHGLLTYALLQGMKGAALREDKWVDVNTLFSYAENAVPRLAGEIGGLQQPHYQRPGAGSFYIGELTAEDRNAISIVAVKPLLLRPTLLNVEEAQDSLGLTSLLRKRLQQSALARGDEAPPFVYVDADEGTGAIAAAGTYTVESGHVKVRLRLSLDTTRLAVLQVEGTSGDLAGLAKQIADAIAAWLSSSGFTEGKLHGER